MDGNCALCGTEACPPSIPEKTRRCTAVVSWTLASCLFLVYWHIKFAVGAQHRAHQTTRTSQTSKADKTEADETTVPK